jgi:hypothetical protein
MTSKREEVQVVLLLSQPIDYMALDLSRHAEDAPPRICMNQLAVVAQEEELRS